MTTVKEWLGTASPNAQTLGAEFPVSLAPAVPGTTLIAVKLALLVVPPEGQHRRFLASVGEMRWGHD